LLDAIKHRLQPRCDELLRCFQLSFLSIQKAPAVFVKQLHIFCIAAYLPCGVESSLASAFQDNAKSVGALLNSGDMLLPAIPRLGDSLADSTTIGYGVLEKRNKNNPLGSNVALVFENPTSAKVELVGDQSSGEETQAREKRPDSVKWSKEFKIALYISHAITGFTGGLIGALLMALWLMTPNEKS
jgi:hypothetical protein